MKRETMLVVMLAIATSGLIAMAATRGPKIAEADAAAVRAKLLCDPHGVEYIGADGSVWCNQPPPVVVAPPPELEAPARPRTQSL